MNLPLFRLIGRRSSLWLCCAILASTAVVVGSPRNSVQASPEEAELKALQKAAEDARTQTDMNIASKDLGDYWEGRIKELEERIVEALDEEGEKLFREAQLRWRSFRDAEVGLYGDVYRGGSIQPLIHNATYSDLTQKRMADLEQFLKDFRWESP